MIMCFFHMVGVGVGGRREDRGVKPSSLLEEPEDDTGQSGVSDKTRGLLI